jgi:tetratricopeptide (TPR) repeat protein
VNDRRYSFYLKSGLALAAFFLLPGLPIISAEEREKPPTSEEQETVRRLRERLKAESARDVSPAASWSVPAEEDEDERADPPANSEPDAPDAHAKKNFPRSTAEEEKQVAPPTHVSHVSKHTAEENAALSSRLQEALDKLRANADWKSVRRAVVLEEVVAAEPNNAEAWYRLGLERLRIGDKAALDAAVEDLNKAALLSPKTARYQCDLGLAALRANWTAKALDACRRAVELAPGYARGHSALGDAFMRAGDPTLAARHYGLAVSMEPTNLDYVHNLGRAHLRAGSARKAAELFDEVIRGRNDDVAALLDRGLAWRELKEAKDALADFRSALRLAPKNPHVHYLLAQIYSDNDDPTFADRFLAVDHAKEAVRLTKEKDARYLMGLAEAYRSCRQYAEALRIARKAVQLDPRPAFRERAADIDAQLRQGFEPHGR